MTPISRPVIPYGNKAFKSWINAFHQDPANPENIFLGTSGCEVILLNGNSSTQISKGSIQVQDLCSIDNTLYICDHVGAISTVTRENNTWAKGSIKLPHIDETPLTVRKLPNGNLFIGTKKGFHTVDPRTKTYVSRFHTPQDYGDAYRPFPYQGKVVSSNYYAINGRCDNHLLLWDTAAQDTPREFNAEAPCTVLNDILYFCRDSKLVGISIKDNKIVKPSLLTGDIFSIVVSTDNNLILGTVSGNILKIDCHSWKIVHRGKGSKCQVVGALANGNIISCGKDGNPVLWDVPPPAPSQPLVSLEL